MQKKLQNAQITKAFTNTDEAKTIPDKLKILKKLTTTKQDLIDTSEDVDSIMDTVIREKIRLTYITDEAAGYFYIAFKHMQHYLHINSNLHTKSALEAYSSSINNQELLTTWKGLFGVDCKEEYIKCE